MTDAATPAPQPNPNELAKAYEPSAIEQKWAEYWVDERLFDVPSGEPEQASKAFTMLLPPPNVTGFLHMGHMFEHAESDILIRWHRMLGERALWVPGTDHAGIATQMLVERQLAKEGATTRQQLGREAFTQRVWDWKQQYGGAITTQMKRLGTSVDWSREYFTMDDRLSAAVVEAFVRLHEQGLIYRGAYIVNWDPILQTAVSDLEVESEERIGKLYHVRYPLADGSGSIDIATTRPETMLGDTAVAVNPGDERYKHLIGRTLKLPLTQREIPILADDWANPEFGTGAVKVTPAHDPNDFAIGQRHALPSLSILDKTARIDLPGSRFHGLDRFEAREQIVAQLQSLDLLVAVKDHPMTVPVSQRSGSVIEPRLSEQWFLAVNKTPAAGGESIAAKAIAAVRTGAIKITPDMYEKTYNEWMSNIHDWCLSRQLWWGHRIPAWHCGACRHITVARLAPAQCSNCSAPASELTQDPDVLDTWFSSGLLPFTVFGWPPETAEQLEAERKEGKGDASFAIHGHANVRPTPDMAAFYPTDLLVTGFDILFFWVARMIMLGTHFMSDVPNPDGSKRPLADAVPFRQVYIHGLIRDANREKMSKTKGNVVDPIEIINRFGTDAVRFTLAAQASPGSDIPLNEARTEGYRAFANKIWNAARFLFMNLDRGAEGGIFVDLEERGKLLPVSTFSDEAFARRAAQLTMPSVSSDAPIESRWIVVRLHNVANEVNTALASFRFDEAADEIYQFFWGDFCDWFLEIVKLRFSFEDAKQRQVAESSLRVLLEVFETFLRLLSPFMPFLTEEIWNAIFRGKPPAKSIALTLFPQGKGTTVGSLIPAQEEMKILQDLVVAIRSQRKQQNVPEKESTEVLLLPATDDVARTISTNQDIVKRLARASTISFVTSFPEGTFVSTTTVFDLSIVYERQIDVPAERERLTKDLAKYEKGLAAASKQLGNEAFTAKAPPHIIEGLRKQSAETQILFDKTKAALEALPAS